MLCSACGVCGPNKHQQVWCGVCACLMCETWPLCVLLSGGNSSCQLVWKDTIVNLNVYCFFAFSRLTFPFIVFCFLHFGNGTMFCLMCILPAFYESMSSFISNGDRKLHYKRSNIITKTKNIQNIITDYICLVTIYSFKSTKMLTNRLQFNSFITWSMSRIEFI